MPEQERRARRARIALVDAPLADYRPEQVTPEGSGPAPVSLPEPRLLRREPTRSLNFHLPRPLDRRLARLKYQLEENYGVRTSKTALVAAAIHALSIDPREVLSLLRAYEAAELGDGDNERTK